MLSRTAENLYWAARYIERADSIVRLLEVGYRISLIPNTNSGYNNEWESILDTSDIKSDYLNYYDKLNKENIEFFLLFDDRNGSSVKNCIEKARENIRSVRTAVTLEVWNAINSSFQELQKFTEKRYKSRELPEIIDWVKKQVNLIRGTILNTQLINDGYDFLILGTYFERADFTARIIDVKYFILLPSADYIGSDIDNFQWSLMLRSISSFRAFKWAYGNKEINSKKIIDFLVLNMMCPRSLIFSIEKINHHLDRLENYYNQKGSKQININKFYEGFKRLNVNRILEIGLHTFLKDFIKKLSAFYLNLEEKYFIGLER
ncbi:alpha-E domain-containing protein [Rickettsiales bacterium]|nr:alpha-E domain-containing protein [Rickettsiales bacterium]